MTQAFQSSPKLMVKKVAPMPIAQQKNFNFRKILMKRVYEPKMRRPTPKTILVTEDMKEEFAEMTINELDK
ncbi:unnamed protein product [Gordionus sp. m RMFG-2023]